MKGFPAPSPELEAAITDAVDAIYRPETTADFSAAGDAVRRLVETDQRSHGSASQQLALGMVLLDMNPPIDPDAKDEPMEDEDESDGVAALPEHIMFPTPEGHVLDQERLTTIAASLLRSRQSTRDALLAYCALRYCNEVPFESHELHALTVARGVSETKAVTDRMTRVYARRVLALVASEPQDVIDAVRQAQEEGNPFEVIRLVEAGYDRVPAPQAMSLIGFGVNAADEMDDPERELEMYILLLDTVTSRFHELYNAASCDEVFERDAEARALAGEFGLLAEAFARFEGNQQLQAVALVELALARAMLDEPEDARAALARAQTLLKGVEAPGGLDVRMHAVEDLLRRNDGDPKADEQPAPDDEPDPDDPRKDPANWWKNN